MIKKGPSLREVLLAAVRWVPEAWTADERLNTTALARYLEKRGYIVSQPTLHRHLVAKTSKPRKLDYKTIEAFHAVFHIPRNMLRGEPMSADTERAILQYGLDVFLLAQKIAELPPKYRESISRQIDEQLEREHELKKAYASSAVTPIRRSTT